MNDFESWARGSKDNVKIKDVVDMNDSRLSTQGFGCYEQLKAMDDMNNSGCCEIKPQDAMNNSWLKMILMSLGHKPMTLIAINSL